MRVFLLQRYFLLCLTVTCLLTLLLASVVGPDPAGSSTGGDCCSRPGDLLNQLGLSGLGSGSCCLTPLLETFVLIFYLGVLPSGPGACTLLRISRVALSTFSFGST